MVQIFSRIFRTIYYFLLVYCYGITWMGQHILCKRYKKLTELPIRSGGTAIVTGGASGIGFEIVKQLLQSDMRVIIACRSVSRGTEAIEKMRSSGINSGSVECIHLDLTSFDSVRKFVMDFTALDIPLNILINNGGIMFTPLTMTEDGIDTELQTNYFSHFLLTQLLLRFLIQGGKDGRLARIVHVSSMAGMRGKVDPDNFLMTKFRDRHLGYCNSKLMQMISACHQNKWLVENNLPVRVYSVHPGMVNTPLFSNTVTYRFFMKFVVMIGCKSPEKGADTIVYVALKDGLEDYGGNFFDNCAIMEPHIQVRDVLVQEKLWQVSCEVTNLKGHSKSIEEEALKGMKDPFVLVDIV